MGPTSRPLRGFGALLAIGVLLAGCPEEKKPAPSAGGGAKAAEHGPGPGAPKKAGAGDADEAAPPTLPPARVTTGEGDAAHRRTVPAGGEVAGEADGGPTSVDLAASGRVRLEGGAVARVGSVAPGQLLLVQGAARAERVASGDRAPALRVATPAVTVAFPVTGTAWVVAAPDGRTWVGVLSGAVELESGALGEDDRLRRPRVGAGHQAWVGADGAVGEPQALPRASLKADGGAAGPKLDARVADHARRLARQGEPLSGDAARQALEGAERSLSGLLEALRAEEGTRRALAEAHRRAATQDPARARALRKRIVAHAKRMLHLHWRLLPVWERVSAWSARVALTGGEGLDLADRRAEVRAALRGEP